ncbi:MAG: ABC transporter substrate-binding protein [Dehalococcoidia bacterium]|nr:ABC transporter substrate-binding protein [Dehalococcoidia bacterium]
MSRTFRIVSLITLIVLVASVVLVGCDSGSSSLSGPIKVGWTGQLSGPSSAFGIPGQLEFKLAVDDINAKGGILNQKMEVIYLDDAGDPTKQMVNVRQLVEKEGVVFIMGGGSAPAAVIPYLTEQKISSVSTNAVEEFNDPTKYPFNYGVLYTNAQVVEKAASYLVNTLGKKKVGVLAPSSATGKDQASLSGTLVPKVGGTVVGTEFVNVGDLDMTTQLQKLKSAGAEALLLWTNAPETPKILLNKKAMGWDVPVSGGAGLSATATVNLAGPDAMKNVFNTWWRTMQYAKSPDDLPQRSKDYIAGMKKVYGDKAEFSWAGKMYDQALLIKIGIERAKSTDADKIRIALESSPLTDLVTGKLVFTSKSHSGVPIEALGLGIASTNKDGAMQLAQGEK